MTLTEELKGMESRVAGVQALAAARALESHERGERYIKGLGLGAPDRYLSKHCFVARYHVAKRGLLHLI